LKRLSDVYDDELKKLSDEFGAKEIAENLLKEDHNGANEYKKGRPKNYLPEENIARLTDLYLNWQQQDGISKIITNDEAAKNDYNLSPSPSFHTHLRMRYFEYNKKKLAFYSRC